MSRRADWCLMRIVEEALAGRFEEPAELSENTAPAYIRTSDGTLRATLRDGAASLFEAIDKSGEHLEVSDEWGWVLQALVGAVYEGRLKRKRGEE